MLELFWICDDGKPHRTAILERHESGQKSQMMSKVAGMYDMQASAGRVALQSRMQDDLSKIEAGKQVTPISAHEWAAVMPLQAAPAERLQMEKPSSNTSRQ